MGQSNSVGIGVLVDSSIPKIGTSMMDDDYNNIEDPNIKMFDGTQFIPGKERMFHITPQPTPTEPPTTYYGFGVSFARQYVKEGKLSTNRKVLLIGCGFHGSGVLRISSSHWNSNIRNSLYDNAIRRVRTAINLPGVGRGSQIKGILWHQGETDATYIHQKEYNLAINKNISAPVVDYIDYKRELKKSLDGLRNEFTNIINTKRTSLPAQVATNIPILLGSILTESTNAELRNRGLDLMVPVIRQIADDRANINYSFVPVTPIAGTVFTKTLTGFGENTDTDWIHLNKSSQIEFGKRYYYVYNSNRITIF
jgi:hypothetical protein